MPVTALPASPAFAAVRPVAVEAAPPPNPLLGPLAPYITAAGDRVQAAIEQNAVARAIGSTVVTYAKPGIDSLAKSTLEPLVDSVGQFADLGGSALETRSASMTISADRAFTDARTAARQLRQMAKDARAWAARAPTDPVARGETQPRDPKTATLAAQVYDAIANGLDELSKKPSTRRLMGTLGETALQIAADGLEIAATLLHAGRRAVGGLIVFAGKALSTLFGSDTLSKTALHFSGSVKLNVLSHGLNAGPGVSLFLPSVDMARKAGSYFDAMVMSYGASVATPVMSASWDRRHKAGADVNLIFLSAAFNEKAEQVFVGIPGFVGFIVGRDFERGSYMCVTQAFPFAGGPGLGAFAGWSITAYTPLMDGVNTWFTRPLARLIGGTGAAISSTVSWIARQVRGWFGAPATEEPAAATPASAEGPTVTTSAPATPTPEQKAA